jgi:hypothetical protein
LVASSSSSISHTTGTTSSINSANNNLIGVSLNLSQRREELRRQRYPPGTKTSSESSSNPKPALTFRLKGSLRKSRHKPSMSAKDLIRGVVPGLPQQTTVATNLQRNPSQNDRVPG